MKEKILKSYTRSCRSQEHIYLIRANVVEKPKMSITWAKSKKNMA